jgi:excisionase family DNA binding protein
MATENRTDSLITAEEVAAYLAVSEAWVAEQARAGEIPAIKLGRYWRFRMSEIEEWLTARSSTVYKRRTA